MVQNRISGGVLSSTTCGILRDGLRWPTQSTTQRVTLKVPGSSKAFVTFCPWPSSTPSPLKSQCHSETCPGVTPWRASVDAPPRNVITTDSLTGPGVSLVNWATGSTLSTVILRLKYVVFATFGCSTLRLTMKGVGLAANVFVVQIPVPTSPDPSFQRHEYVASAGSPTPTVVPFALKTMGV